MLDMSRISRTVRRTAPIFCLVALSSCSGASGSDVAESDYEDGAGITASVLPQIASVGEDAEKSSDAEYVVDATIEGATAGRTVELQVADGDDWTTEDTAETDDEGRVALTVGEAGTSRSASTSPPTTLRPRRSSTSSTRWTTPRGQRATRATPASASAPAPPTRPPRSRTARCD